MIRSLSLKFFRKHEDLQLTLQPGLNVLRGANEGGKSTVIEGLLYALYGAKALRGSLAETVTWGHKEGELRATAVINVSNCDYVFTRHKGGAECTYDPGTTLTPLKVTGQAEVSAFAAELLGADAKTAALLMLASQSGLRGAIDDGPAAVSGLMAKLANFDLIDKIIARAEERLLVGSPNYIQATIDTTKIELEKNDEEIPDENLAAGLEDVRANLAARLTAKQEVFEASVKPVVDAAFVAYSEARALEDKKRDLKRQIDDKHNLYADIAGKIVDIDKIIAKRPKPEEIDKLYANIEAETNKGVLMEAYQKFKALPAYPTIFWDKPVEDFKASLARMGEVRNRLVATIAAHELEIKRIKRECITDGKCPTCGHVPRSAEDVQRHNDEVMARAAEVQKVMDTLVAEKPATDANFQAMLDVMASAEPAEKLLDWALHRAEKLDGALVFNTSEYPFRVRWDGEVPEVKDTAPLKAHLADMQARERRALQMEGERAARMQQIMELERQHLALTEQHEDLVVPNVELLAQQYAEAGQVVAVYEQEIEILREQVMSAERQRDIAIEKRKVKVARSDELRATLEKLYTDLATLTTNNQLLTKLKKLKPSITDHLWNQVLAAVSAFFSQLRGEQSIVTKDSSGFKVNDKSVDSLSGSTIDVLALAVRVALSKTFVPHASFMVLDEPAHGCDIERTGNVLGFLSSVGFQQTLLASHDELSEAVADNVIVVGG
jgi:DNA repair exonuclease SbcCD ATPase subunit